MKTLVGIISAALIGMTGCKRPEDCTLLQTMSLEKHDVDQVFRDHDGYRVIFDDKEGMVHERKYFTNFYCSKNAVVDLELNNMRKYPSCSQPVTIFKDLPQGTQGYAHVLSVRGVMQEYQSTCDARGTFVEIHLPKDARLSPGNETHGGKYKTHDSMSEIK